MAKIRPQDGAHSDPQMPNTSTDECQSISTEAKNWDIFRLLPPKPDNPNNSFWLNVSLQILKLSTFFLLFALTLISGVVAKSSFLLMTAGIGNGGRNVSICTDKIPEASTNTVYVSTKVAAKWAWSTLLALCAPELLCFARSFHRTMFRNVKRPTIVQFLVVLFFETLHGFGIGALVFGVFPNFPSNTSAMLGNAVCLVPSVLTALSRRPNRWFLVLIVLDLCAIGAQTSAYWFWPAVVAEIRPKVILICICVLFISCAWWQNFVSPKSFLPPIRGLAAFSAKLSEKRSKTYVIVSLCKCFIYVFCLFFFLTPRMPLHDLIQRDPFGEKLITITAENLNQTQISNFLQRMHQYETPDYKLPEDDEDGDKKATTKEPWDPDNGENIIDANDYDKPSNQKKAEKKEDKSEKNSKTKRSRREAKKAEEEEEVISAYNIYDDYVELNQFTSPYDSIWIALVQIISVIVFYHSSKFACKVLMQRAGFALPTFLVVPVTVIFLTDSCSARLADACFMSNFLSKELFWHCQPRVISFWSWDFWLSPQNWIWLGWLLSQFWISIHLWTPKHERLTRSEKLFVLTYYNSFFIDQALAFNRRRDDKVKIRAEDIDFDFEDTSQTYETIGLNGQLPKTPPSICSMASSRPDNGLIRDTASAADGITKIYACATLWHESPLEMYRSFTRSCIG